MRILRIHDSPRHCEPLAAPPPLTPPQGESRAPPLWGGVGGEVDCFAPLAMTALQGIAGQARNGNFTPLSSMERGRG